jgi:hydrogenase/urease accessory protein HupE
MNRGIIRETNTIFFLLIILVSLLWLSQPPTAKAHFSSTIGYSTILIEGNRIHYLLDLDADQLRSFTGIDTNKNGVIEENELSQSHSKLKEFIAYHLLITSDGTIGQMNLQNINLIHRGNASFVHFNLEYVVEKQVTNYQIQYKFYFDGFDPGHQNLVTITSGDQRIEKVINQSDNVVAGKVSSPSKWWNVLYEYTVMGMHHIWSGMDHILFVLGLIISAVNKRDFVKIVTAFTLGHSVTLALAATDSLILPASIVEPLIALSIVYIAIENIFLKSHKWRWAISLLFGFAHGFGFADLLRGKLDNDFILPLFSFNFGVEIGQIVVLLLALPIIWFFRKTRLQHQATLGVSGLIGFSGIYWLIERIL